MYSDLVVSFRNMASRFKLVLFTVVMCTFPFLIPYFTNDLTPMIFQRLTPKNDMCVSSATSAAAIDKSPLHFRPLPLRLHTAEGLYFWDDSHRWTGCLVCCLWCYAVPPQQGESSGVGAHRQVRPCWHLSFAVRYVWQFTLRCGASRFLLGWRGGSKCLGCTGLQTDFFFFFSRCTLQTEFYEPFWCPGSYLAGCLTLLIIAVFAKFSCILMLHYPF